MTGILPKGWMAPTSGVCGIAGTRVYGTPLFGAGDAGDPHVVALRSADNLKLGHRSPPLGMFGTLTTRESAGIDSAVDFYPHQRLY
jgi:hypothetical protein